MSNREVETIRLKNAVSIIINQKNFKPAALLELLDQCPIASNYLIERKFTLIGLRPFIVQYFKTPKGPSEVKLSEHISIHNLTPEAKVTLSASQYQALNNLL
jgi:hypothetical protein